MGWITWSEWAMLGVLALGVALLIWAIRTGGNLPRHRGISVRFQPPEPLELEVRAWNSDTMPERLGLPWTRTMGQSYWPPKNDHDLDV